MNTIKFEKVCQDFMDELNPRWREDPDMKETPTRIANMYVHFFRNEDVLQHFEKRFPTENKQMVVLKDIECFGMCPHHLIPVIYSVHIGYVPQGWAIGLSKLARIAVGLCSYPKLQENFTCELAEAINKNLNPRGVMVVVEGLHGCIRCRGVEMPSSCITSEVKGLFLKNQGTRQEFLSLLNMH